MALKDGLSLFFLLAAAPFFLAGSIGLLRFPDLYCRLHALTKADNVGLGLLLVGVLWQVSSWLDALKLLLIWLLVLVAGATVAHLIARNGLRQGLKPWERP
jgi:multicomponent Na+:H+ antiporter subunit G